MDVSTYLCFAFLGCLALVNLVQAQDQSGFISLDCGLPANTTYIEPELTLQFYSDAAYINTGVSKSLSSNYQQFIWQQFLHVRSFPEGRRNCYNIGLKNNIKYLMRATFMYGNYDGLNQLPKFDLYFSDSLWSTINITNEHDDITIESIHVTSNNKVQICLVNTNNGTPFISSLEFRPLPTETYNALTRSLLLTYRLDMGAKTNKTSRFPDDIYDRIWVSYSQLEWTSKSTTSTIDLGVVKNYQPGSAVMETVSTPINNTIKTMEMGWEPEDENTEYYVYMHYAEVENLQPNQTRGFNIIYNGDLWYGPLIPQFLHTSTIFSVFPLAVPTKRHQFSLIPIENSTLPPIINAAEVYSVIDLLELTSDQGDVEAIKSIKSTYEIMKDWEGDPCVPRAYPWEGIDCTKTNGTAPKIVTLNLSSSGLAGEISPHIRNLTMLQILDLSNNNLTGNIPDFLSGLSNLKVLKLNNNTFTGSVPSQLIKRFSSSSFEGNPNLEYCRSDSCKGKKKSVVIPIVASIGGLVVVVVISIIIHWIVKSKKKPKKETDGFKKDPSGTNNHVMSEADALIKNPLETNNQEINDQLLETRKQFTYVEVLNMTKNFETVLGRGGFGIVYYGVIDDIPVAVKIPSQASSHGYQQFQTEVTILLKAHHKKLTNLVGYLNEGEHLGLIYEFMANGNLAEHLSENSLHVLSWEDRLKIAMDAAQGLEYLHDGCKLPIVHRDVKTTNILLTEKFEAKLADFGLSKSFPTSSNNHVSTIVAGTFGYLDPEYLTSNRLTKKSDVYSFGVVLLEIISGRSISGNEENVHISEWVRSKVEQGDINGIIDERLMGKYDANSVWKAVEIGLNCVQKKSVKRPWMSQVVAELKSCLADVGLEPTPETPDLDSMGSVDMISIVLSSSEAAPMAR